MTPSNVPKIKITAVLPVYRNAAEASDVIRALFACNIPADVSLDIKVVDDGSGDGTPDELRRLFDSRIALTCLHVNRGRSVARNSGAREANADYLFFLDSDCVPIDADLVFNHLKALRSGRTVSMGIVHGQNDGFWHDYQCAAWTRRKRIASIEPAALFTTQNVMISKALFTAVGGFDEAYRGYGFEDRDLALRLEASGGTFAFNAEAGVIHRDSLTLAKVCSKMVEAGRLTAQYFSVRHPGAYRSLGYAAIDADLHPIRGWAASLLKRLGAPIIRHDAWLNADWIPLATRIAVVRLLSAISYIEGTRTRA